MTPLRPRLLAALAALLFTAPAALAQDIPPKIWDIPFGTSIDSLSIDFAEPACGTTVYMPVPKPRDRTRDPHRPRRGDSLAVAAWRIRMGTDAAKTIYRERAATAECVNAIARNRGLQAFRVRGRTKVRAVLLWFALAHNLMRAISLRAAIQPS